MVVIRWCWKSNFSKPSVCIIDVKVTSIFLSTEHLNGAHRRFRLWRKKWVIDTVGHAERYFEYRSQYCVCTHRSCYEQPGSRFCHCPVWGSTAENMPRQAALGLFAWTDVPTVDDFDWLSVIKEERNFAPHQRTTTKNCIAEQCDRKTSFKLCRVGNGCVPKVIHSDFT